MTHEVVLSIAREGEIEYHLMRYRDRKGQYRADIIDMLDDVSGGSAPGREAAGGDRRERITVCHLRGGSRLCKKSL
jgi:hypothetical protein